MKKNDIVRLKIVSATAEGSGVGKTEDNMTVYINKLLQHSFSLCMWISVIPIQHTYFSVPSYPLFTPPPSFSCCCIHSGARFILQFSNESFWVGQPCFNQKKMPNQLSIFSISRTGSSDVYSLRLPAAAAFVGIISNLKDHRYYYVNAA